MYISMEQIGFFPLNNASNIYGLTNVRGNDRKRILVATLEKQIFSIEYSDHKKFTCNEIHFAYIPNGADIISIDSFVRSNCNDIVVGITFFKNYKESDSNEFRKNIVVSNRQSSSTPEKSIWNHYYLNIYSSLSSMNKFDLNQIAQDCQTFELDFVPYHLYYTSITNENKISENLWLLSGSDCCVHVFREDTKKQCFYKEKIDLFPELNNFESIVLWVDVLNYEENNELRRLSVVGCENGNVHLFFVELEDPNNPRIIKSWKNHFDGPVVSVKFFKDSLFNQSWIAQKLNSKAHFSPEIHLLVMNSYGNPTVYRNVQENGLLTRKSLSNTGLVDIFLASFIADFNFDGNNEILLGSYGKKLQFYKYDEKKKDYQIENTINVSHPILNISYLDLTDDGVNELLIITTKGIIIYRHNINQVLKTLKEKINNISLAAVSCNN